VRAIVTTNFDRTLEAAFHQTSTPLHVMLKDQNMAPLALRLREGGLATKRACC
jgi:hypothetical protein